jgi:hypothetical protein
MLCSDDIQLEQPTQTDTHLLCSDGLQVGKAHRNRCCVQTIFSWNSLHKQTLTCCVQMVCRLERHTETDTNLLC